MLVFVFIPQSVVYHNLTVVKQTVSLYVFSVEYNSHQTSGEEVCRGYSAES